MVARFGSLELWFILQLSNIRFNVAFLMNLAPERERKSISVTDIA